MTNEEFKIWRKTYFSCVASAASFLDMSRGTIDALETGFTRNGTAYPVKHHVALSCMAVARGLVVVPKKLAARVRTPAPGRSMSEQTKLILARANGERTAQQIADELKVKTKAVYSAVDSARKKGLTAKLAYSPHLINPAGRAGKREKSLPS